MDETPVYFDLPGSRTVHPTGEKTVLVKQLAMKEVILQQFLVSVQMAQN